jgi:hypothetical protein
MLQSRPPCQPSRTRPPRLNAPSAPDLEGSATLTSTWSRRGALCPLTSHIDLLCFSVQRSPSTPGVCQSRLPLRSQVQTEQGSGKWPAPPARKADAAPLPRHAVAEDTWPGHRPASPGPPALPAHPADRTAAHSPQPIPTCRDKAAETSGSPPHAHRELLGAARQQAHSG